VIAGPVTVSEISGDHAWHRQKGLYFLSGPNKMRPKRLGQRIQCLSCLTKSGLRAGTHKINVVEKHSKSHTLTVVLLPGVPGSADLPLQLMGNGLLPAPWSPWAPVANGERKCSVCGHLTGD